jgi:hypothetical protein
VKESHSTWLLKNPTYVNSYERKRRFNRKIKTILHYGNKCACCGEKNLGFLTLHHLNNDGAEHRQKLFGNRKYAGSGFYYWLEQNNYPNDPPLQVLCWNCNSGSGFNNGVCPHKDPKYNTGNGEPKVPSNIPESIEPETD